MTTNLIAVGKHRAIVRATEEGLRFGLTGEGETEKEQAVVLFDLVDPADPDHGRSITWFGFLSDAAFDRTIEGLRHCGWQGESLAELPGLAAVGGLAQEVELVIEHEEYNDKWQAKVQWVNRPGGGGVKLKRPLEGAELEAFSARMRGRVRVAGTQARAAAPNAPRPPHARPATPNGGGAGQRPTHPNAPGSPVDDDIPFLSADPGREPSPIARVLRR